ncbi:ead/Ea22-like family protein [Chromobacterium phragmitis]|uniref:ead/Ea22-like family protein n=1 Tax=Chromobacterium phragmitis TaxID=2202141 RepID=UPI003877CCE9
MITPDQLAALRAAAEAAHQPGVFWYQQDMLERFTKQFTGADADATYISVANPAAVLALLDHIEAQAARIAELERERDHWKANHDNQVQRTRILMERPDMPFERVRAYERYAELEQDAARYRWLTQDAHIGECFTEQGIVLEICGTDREIPILHERATDRDEVDAAIDAAMELQCTS